MKKKFLVFSIFYILFIFIFSSFTAVTATEGLKPSEIITLPKVEKAVVRKSAAPFGSLVKIHSDDNFPAHGEEMFSANEKQPWEERTYNNNPANILLPIKNQGSNGSCWSFSAVSALEHRLFKDGISVNYSENHMLHSLVKGTSEIGVSNPLGFDAGFEGGGNFSMAMAYYSRGSGPVLESDDPYPSILSLRPLADTNRFVSQKYVTDIYQLENLVDFSNISADPGDAAREAHVEKMKPLIVKYGGLTQSVYSSNTNFNTAKTALYYPKTGNQFPDHAVYIVGWDDDYPKTNFKTQPPENGAFLVANSWGTAWGDCGYFWLSYYDKYTGTECGTIADVTDADKYDKIYQYDEFGACQDLFFPGFDTLAVTTVYHGAMIGEKLKAVSFNTTMENVSYKIYFNNGDLGEAETIFINKSGAEEAINYAGFHTVEINEQVIAGNDFTITIEFSANSAPVYYAPVSANILGHVSQFSGAENESYIYPYSFDGLRLGYTENYRAATIKANYDVFLNYYINQGYPPEAASELALANLEGDVTTWVNDVLTEILYDIYRDYADTYYSWNENEENLVAPKSACVKAHTVKPTSPASMKNSNGEIVTKLPPEGDALAIRVKHSDTAISKPAAVFSIFDSQGRIIKLECKELIIGNNDTNIVIPTGSDHLDTVIIDFNTMKPLSDKKGVLHK